MLDDFGLAGRGSRRIVDAVCSGLAKHAQEVRCSVRPAGSKTSRNKMALRGTQMSLRARGKLLDVIRDRNAGQL
jgi:hypothetical protein